MRCSKCIHKSNKGLKFAIRALHNIKITTLFLVKEFLWYLGIPIGYPPGIVRKNMSWKHNAHLWHSIFQITHDHITHCKVPCNYTKKKCDQVFMSLHYTFLLCAISSIWYWFLLSETANSITWRSITWR
jgi:hypothetical protein